jgi:two-component system, response regulator, stage 0 sporulation protein F
MTGVARGMRVVVADDDPDLREVIAEALRVDGFEVIEAANGAQLLDLVGPTLLGGPEGGAPAELVVSDLRMPGVTGMSVLGGLRDLPWRPPFILITAFGDAETHAEARRLGASAVLDKPFEMRVLVRLVRQCLGVS